MLVCISRSPDQHEHPDSSTSTSSNFNKAKEMFERLSDPENSPTNSPERKHPTLIDNNKAAINFIASKMMTTRPQSSKPKSKHILMNSSLKIVIIFLENYAD